MTTIFERRGNPARNMYRLWDEIIKINGGHSAAYGPMRGTIYRINGANAIGYGGLRVTEEGRFFLPSMRGSHGRKAVSEGTFLGFRYWRGYNWFVDFQPAAYWQSLWSVESYEQPMPYVSEGVIGNQHWRKGLWLELVPHTPTHGEAPWQIVPAKSQRDARDPWSTRAPLDKEQKARWERFVALRERRYERLRHEALGLPSTPRNVSVRTPSVVTNGTKIEGDEAVWAIQALLDVHQPAKLASRLKEAHA